MANNKILTVVSTGVQGVKGAGESVYRDGYVNLTPENIGFNIIELAEGEGTLSSAELKALKDNLHNCIGYSPDDLKYYIFKLISKSTNQWQYVATKEDLTGIMAISVNPTTGAYLYSYQESHTETQIETITEDVEEISQSIEDIQADIDSLTMNGGEIV